MLSLFLLHFCLLLFTALYPHIVSVVTYITPAPRMAPNLYLVFKPLALDVWIGFILSLLICALFDLLYNWVLQPPHHIKIFWDSIYMVFHQQYSSCIPETSPYNTWMFFWSLATFVLTAGYAGCLCSLITIPIKMDTIDTIHELVAAAKSHHIIVLGVDNSAYTNALKASKQISGNCSNMELFFGVHLQSSKLPLYAQLGKLIKLVKTKEEGFAIVSRTKKPHSFISMRESLQVGQIIHGKDSIYIPMESADSAFFTDLLTFPVKPSFQHTKHFNLAYVTTRLSNS